jgi:hypothetical protein
VDFSVIGHLLIRFYIYVRCWTKKWEHSGTVHQLFTELKKVYDSGRREVLYSILIEFIIHMNLVRALN